METLTLEQMAREFADQIEYDPRLAALRGEHEWLLMAIFDSYEEYQCSKCNTIAKSNCGVPESDAGVCPRTDLGSIVRAIAACERTITYMFIFPDMSRAQVNIGDDIEAAGDTVEDAAMLALYEAVNG